MPAYLQASHFKRNQNHTNQRYNQHLYFIILLNTLFENIQQPNKNFKNATDYSDRFYS